MNHTTYYETHTPAEYLAVLKQAIRDGMPAILGPRTAFPYDNYIALGFCDIADGVRLILQGAYGDTMESLLTRFTNPDREAKVLGVYANGRIYDPGYKFLPDENDNLQILRTTSCSTVRKIIAGKINEFIRTTLLDTYPSLASMPEKYKNAAYEWFSMKQDFNAKSVYEARNRILEGKDKNPFPVQVNEEAYSLPDCIAYDKAADEGQEEPFIRALAEKHLAKTEYKSTVQEQYTFSLARYYVLQDAIQKCRENPNPEDLLFLAIRKAVESFLETNPDAKSVKVTLAGKDENIQEYIRKDSGFSIEGKPVILSAEPGRLTRFDTEKTSYYTYGFTIESPVLKQKYSNRNRDYLERIRPSDIESVTYGRKIIYKKN